MTGKRLTRTEALDLAYKEILPRQRNEKFNALSRILEDYKTMIDKSERRLFRIIHGAKCKKCGGIILEMTYFFPVITCGGNPIVGCPVCDTFHSGEMLICRNDIEYNYLEAREKAKGEQGIVDI